MGTFSTEVHLYDAVSAFICPHLAVYPQGAFQGFSLGVIFNLFSFHFFFVKLLNRNTDDKTPSKELCR